MEKYQSDWHSLGHWALQKAKELFNVTKSHMCGYYKQCSAGQRMFIKVNVCSAMNFHMHASELNLRSTKGPVQILYNCVVIGWWGKNEPQLQSQKTHIICYNIYNVLRVDTVQYSNKIYSARISSTWENSGSSIPSASKSRSSYNLSSASKPQMAVL
jgi:hypothetical protein